MNRRWITGIAVMVLTAMSTTFASAQQQREELVVQQRIQFQLVNNAAMFANARVLGRDSANRGLTPVEMANIDKALNDFLSALEKQSGDNELAAAFNYEEGTITRYKPSAAPELLKFDPAGGKSLRDWLTMQMPPKVLRDWMKGGWSPTKTEDGKIFVRMTPSNLIGPVHVFEFEPAGDGLRIRSIASHTSGC